MFGVNSFVGDFRKNSTTMSIGNPTEPLPGPSSEGDSLVARKGSHQNQDAIKYIHEYSMRLNSGHEIEVTVCVTLRGADVQLKNPPKTVWSVKGKRYPREMRLHDISAHEDDVPLLTVDLEYLKCSKFFVLPLSSLFLTLDQDPVLDYLEHLYPPWIILMGKKPTDLNPVKDSIDLDMTTVDPPNPTENRFFTADSMKTLFSSLHFSSVANNSTSDFDSYDQGPPSTRNVFHNNRVCLFYAFHLLCSEFMLILLLIEHHRICEHFPQHTSTCIIADIIVAMFLIAFKLMFQLVVCVKANWRFIRNIVFVIINFILLILHVTTGLDPAGNKRKWTDSELTCLILSPVLTLLDFCYLYKGA